MNTSPQEEVLVGEKAKTGKQRRKPKCPASDGRR